jgi:hypothetical protein
LSYARLRAFGFTPQQAHAIAAAGFTVTFVPLRVLVGAK